MFDILYEILDWFLSLISYFKKYIIITFSIIISFFIIVLLFKHFNIGNSATDLLYSSNNNGIKRICISLKELERRVSSAISEGESIPKECADMCGLSYVEGYVVDDSNDKDIIIIGLQSKSRPTIRLDDLILTMRNLTTSDYPYCSLDPLPENVKKCEALDAEFAKSRNSNPEDYLKRLKEAIGPQKVIVEGVPFNSRISHVMVEADYHMKKVAQGHIMLPNVKSYLDITAGNDNLNISRSRFWFHIAEGNPTYEEDVGIMWINQCKLIVLTKKQGVTSTGQLLDVEDDDPVANEFAVQFSEQLPIIAQFVPVYADLENLFRLRALLLFMYLRDALSVIDSNFQSYLHNYKFLDEKEMEPSYYGLVNFRQKEMTTGSLIQTTTNYISGGVSQEMKISAENISYDEEILLQEIFKKVKGVRPNNESLWWYMN